MGTPENTFSLTTDRNARIAVAASVALAISVISFSSLISSSLFEESPSIVTMVEMLVVLGQVATIISAMFVILR